MSGLVRRALMAAAKRRAASGDPFFANVVFLANFETDKNDVKGHALLTDSASVSLGGGAITTTGSDPSYLAYADAADIRLATGDYTIEIIIDPGAPVGGGSYIQKGQYSNTGTWPTPGYGIRNIGADLIRAYFDTTTSNSTEKYVDYTHRSSGGPMHIAMVKNGTTGTLYVDGTASGTVGLSAGISSSTHRLEFGRFDYTVGPIYQQMAMHAARISNVARYTADFTPPTSFPEA